MDSFEIFLQQLGIEEAEKAHIFVNKDYTNSLAHQYALALIGKIATEYRKYKEQK